MKMPGSWNLFFIPLTIFSIYISFLRDTSIASKWETWVLIVAFLIISVCTFLLKLEKYQSLFVLVIITLNNLFSNLSELLKNNIESYYSCLMGSLLWAGFFLGMTPVIRIQIRKWIVLSIVIISLGSLYLYPIYFPNKLDKVGEYPILLAMTIINIMVFVLVTYREKKEKEKELEQLKQAQTQAKLSSLKDQLSPHFLFNTLNTITSISQEQTVKDFVDEVANIYRYVLQFKEVDSVTLRQEMEFIQSYLYIIKSRLEGGIDFDINIENENLLDSKMPPLTLQMLIENAVKHNSTSIDKPLSIKLFTTEGPMLVVQNIYQPKLSVLPGNETGLKNIAERYRLLYKKEIVVENKNGFFTVKLPIVMA